MSAPQLWIGRQRMDDYALSQKPVLAGLSFDWGTDSPTELDDPATLTAELLIAAPSDLGFLVKGAEVGLIDPGSGETLFAGRIATLKARQHPQKKKALLLTLTAADTQADLAGYRIASANWTERASDGTLQVSSTRRRQQLRSALPPGWVLDGETPQDWHMARAQLFEGEPFLPVLDRHARTVIGRRSFTSRYIPGTGLAPRVTISDERSKTAPLENLSARDNGVWHRYPRPPRNSGFTDLPARCAGADTEWEKTPDDTVTDVALTSWGSMLANDENTGQLVNQLTSSSDVWVDSYLPAAKQAELAALQAAYGYQQLQLDTDLFAGSPLAGNPMIEKIVSYWLEADTLWRPTGLTIPDSRKLSDEAVLTLLSVTRRYLAYVFVSGMGTNTPAGGTRIRGYLLGGSATWTGKKWSIEIILGRVPRPAPGAGNITFTTIRNHENPAISAGTARTVGTELTFADFAYIGD